MFIKRAIGVVILFLTWNALLACDIKTQSKQTGDMGILWEKDGHLYTTFVVARLAELSVDRALELSWGSQVPDDKTRFSATAAFFYFWNPSYRGQIMATLHSLHGGKGQEVHKRREDLKRLLREGQTSAQRRRDWQTGLIIHAFGDSYAHTKMVGKEEVAFSYGFGHFFEGRHPDLIVHHKDKYMQYAMTLYYSFTGNTHDNGALDRLRRAVDRVASIDDGKRELDSLAKELELNRDNNRAACERLMAMVDRTKVKETIQLMERAFAEHPQVQTSGLATPKPDVRAATR